MYDILPVCIGRKGKLSYFAAHDAIMNGFPVALIENQGCAPILDAIAHIGKNQETEQ